MQFASETKGEKFARILTMVKIEIKAVLLLLQRILTPRRVSEISLASILPPKPTSNWTASKTQLLQHKLTKCPVGDREEAP